MSDEELNRRCAWACGWYTGMQAIKIVAYQGVHDCAVIASNDQGGESVWDPLHDDAQAFGLLKRFGLQIDGNEGHWACAEFLGPKLPVGD